MIGIYDCFGYGTGYEVSFEERYKLIKNVSYYSWSSFFIRKPILEVFSPY